MTDRQPEIAAVSANAAGSGLSLTEADRLACEQADQAVQQQADREQEEQEEQEEQDEDEEDGQIKDHLSGSNSDSDAANSDADSDYGSESDIEHASPAAPPLPDEKAPPPLPAEALPGQEDGDDGWEPVWDATAQAYYFYNRFSGVSQWENPRVPSAHVATDTAETAETAERAAATATTAAERTKKPSSDAAAAAPTPELGGYNPAIHGDYDPTAPYAQQYEQQSASGLAAMDSAGRPAAAAVAAYAATGAFNRFTGRWQPHDLTPENFNDESKARRQMRAFFDVDAAANSHDGRSLKAERSAKKLSRKELKMFKEKRREKKEEKRRAWLRD